MPRSTRGRITRPPGRRRSPCAGTPASRAERACSDTSETDASSKRERMASAHARMPSALCRDSNSSANSGSNWAKRNWWAVRSARMASMLVSMSSPTCASMPSRMARTSSRGRSAGSGMLHASSVVGTYGQASSQPIVTAQSACSCISRSSFLSLRSAMSMPTSRITSTTSGQTCRAAVEPADSALRAPASPDLRSRTGAR